MKNPSVGIVGMGVVGSGMMRLFPWAIWYDKSKGGDKKKVNETDFCFVCVPTPMLSDGSCDISIVEEVVDWLQSDIIIVKSTIPPGTTEKLILRTGKKICFSPEYMGETQHSRPKNDFVILGGKPETTSCVAQLYQQSFDCSLKIRQTDTKTAELVKYMENSFLACKVVFCNEFYRISNQLEIDYTELRELFLQDSRQNRSHTFVYEQAPYYDSKCFNKDLPALVAFSKKQGFMPKFIQAVIDRNEEYFKKA